MANCNECISVNPIPRCATSWIIGQVNVSYATDILDYILTNASTGNHFVGTTEAVAGDGTVTITLPTEILELMDHLYELSVYELDGTETIELTVDTTSQCCIEFSTTSLPATAVTFSTDVCLTS